MTERIDPWGRAVDGRDPNWAEVFDGYRSTVDWPGCAYWSELAAAHPDAKVILSVRDPQRWYDSVHDTLYQFVKQEPSEEDELLPRLRNDARQLSCSPGTASARSRNRRSSAASAMSASARAKAAPRQKCGPWPNEKCRHEPRSSWRESGFGRARYEAT